MGLKQKSKDIRKTAMIFSAQEEDAAQIRQFLASRSVDVKEWNRSGFAWIDKWKNLKPWIVFVDYLMARKDGLFIIRNINHYEPEMFTVFMHSYTGFGANDLEMKALKVGAKAILQKPLTEAKLKTCLEHFLAK